MIWTTWRQHRAEAGIAAAVLIVLLTGLIKVGQLARVRARGLGLPSCLQAQRDCSTALDHLHRDFHSIPPFTGFLVALPLLAGMFWASPLVSREYEAGTQRLAWSQSVSPRRWILTKIALIFGVLGAAALIVGLVATWALDPLTPAFGGRYNSTWYDIQGIVPVACMLFALSAGLLTSVALRRTVPAMAVTLVVYAAARIPIHWLRPHLLLSTTGTTTAPMGRLLDNLLGGPADVVPSAAPTGSLIQSTMLTVQPGGHALSATQSTIDVLHHYCPTLQVTRGANDAIQVAHADACRTALHDLSLQATTHFVSPSQFWALQAIELAVFVGAAVVLTAAAVLLVARRRRA